MKRLYRSRENKRIAGICGGLGEMFEIDPTLIRLIVVFMALLSAVLPLLITYVIGWIIIPKAPEGSESGL